MLSKRFISMASLSLVPTPSVDATRSGSLKPAAFKSNRPPKPPKSAAAPRRAVAFAAGAIRETNASPASMSTPASLYVKRLRPEPMLTPARQVHPVRSTVTLRKGAQAWCPHARRRLSGGAMRRGQFLAIAVEAIEWRIEWSIRPIEGPLESAAHREAPAGLAALIPPEHQLVRRPPLILGERGVKRAERTEQMIDAGAAVRQILLTPFETLDNARRPVTAV